MKTFTLDKDITIFYITASSFPEGVLTAHEELHSLVPFSTERKFFGVSRPEEDGPIVYRAAAEELFKGEAKKFNCDTLVLKKGEYIGKDVKNYINDVQSVQLAFDEILEQPALDPKGYCVELYLSEKDVRCMIRLEN
ncbi:MAG TPA: transcriptional regulator [Cyclobacteriaceae bacterium]